MNEFGVNESVQALADHDRPLEAPDAVELRLRAAFRKQHRRKEEYLLHQEQSPHLSKTIHPSLGVLQEMDFSTAGSLT